MYNIIKDGSRIAVQDRAVFIRKNPKNSLIVGCTEPEAHGLVVDDTIYHLAGKPPLPGAETVIMEEFDGAAALGEVYAAADERILNLEYENLMLKGGFAE